MSMAQTQTIGSGWSSHYKIGAIVAVILIAYSLVTMVQLVAIGGQPETAIEAFSMLEENRIVGLLRLDVLTLLIVPLYYPLFLSLYSAFRKTHPARATLATMLAVVGVTLFLATPSASSLVSLSDRFAHATTETERDQLLAAGEAILASDLWHGTGAVIGGILWLAATLLFAVLMLRSDAFGRFTAYVGIVTHGLDLARSLIDLLFPGVGIFLMAIAGPLYLVWYPLLARDLFRLGRRSSKG